MNRAQSVTDFCIDLWHQAEVDRIFAMYRALIDAQSRAQDRNRYELSFAGFSRVLEGEYYRRAARTLGQTAALYIGRKSAKCPNSVQPMMPTYLRMLDVWQKAECRYALSSDELDLIMSVGPPDNDRRFKDEILEMLNATVPAVCDAASDALLR